MNYLYDMARLTNDVCLNCLQERRIIQITLDFDAIKLCLECARRLPQVYEELEASRP